MKRRTVKRGILIVLYVVAELLLVAGVFAFLGCLLIIAGGCDGQVRFESGVSPAPAPDLPDPGPLPEPRPDIPCPDGQCPRDYSAWRDVAPMDLPIELRCENYAGGSCSHAALISVLRWQGLDAIADQWRKTYAGAAGVTDLARHAETLKLRYAYTTRGDEAFLQWASDTRRGAAIHYFPNHAITFCGYDASGQAVLLDNNRVQSYIRVPKGEFVRAWKSYGGCALTVVYQPPPPKPWVFWDRANARAPICFVSSRFRDSLFPPGAL